MPRPSKAKKSSASHVRPQTPKGVRLTTAQQAKAQWEEKEKDYIEKLAKLEQELISIQGMLAEESSKRQILQEQKEAYDVAVKVLKSEVIFHETERTEWGSNEETFMETVAALKSFNEELQLVLKEQENKYSSLKNEKSVLKNDLTYLQERISCTQKENQELQENVDKLNENLVKSMEVQQESVAKYEKLQDEMEKSCKSLSDELEAMKKVQAELQEKNEESQKLITQLQEKLETTENLKLKLSSDFEAQCKEMDMKLSKEKVESEKQRTSWLASEEKYTRLVDDQKNRIEQMETHCNELEETLFKLKEEVNA